MHSVHLVWDKVAIYLLLEVQTVRAGRFKKPVLYLSYLHLFVCCLLERKNTL